MGAFEIIAVWGLLSLVAGLVGAVVAGLKRRDHSAWAAWCFVFPPVLIVLFLVPRNKGERPRRPSMDEDDAHEHSTV